MTDVFILAAFLLFGSFFFAGQQKKYAAIGGWTLIVINLFSEVPAYLKAENFLYPTLAIGSIPFLALTVSYLLSDDPIVLQLSKTAAIATIIYMPFAFVPVLRDWLVIAVVNQSFWIIQALGHHPQMPAWNIIMENGFANQIVLACTGITAISITIGVVAGLPDLSWRQGAFAFLGIVPLLTCSTCCESPSFSLQFQTHGSGFSRIFPAIPDWERLISSGPITFLLKRSQSLLFSPSPSGCSGLCPGLGVFIRGLVDRYAGPIKVLCKRLSA